MNISQDHIMAITVASSDMEKNNSGRVLSATSFHNGQKIRHDQISDYMIMLSQPPILNKANTVFFVNDKQTDGSNGFRCVVIASETPDTNIIVLIEYISYRGREKVKLGDDELAASLILEYEKILLECI